jgi:hypothetical protein
MAPDGSQLHRRDKMQSDGTWHDYVDQEDCCESPVIAALPELRLPVQRLERLPSGDDLDGE